MTTTYVCNFCGDIMKSKRTLDFHVKNSKKCISLRTIEGAKCIWCSSDFLTKNALEIHHKVCKTDKEIIYTKAIEEFSKKEQTNNSQLQMFKDQIKEYKDQIQEYKEHVKELEDKIFKLANKTNTTTINTNTTINNVTLVCDKPLIISEERILNILITKCTANHLLKGEKGVAELIINHICRNEQGNLCLECTDVKRKNLRYIDENEVQQLINIDKFMDIIKLCLISFRKHQSYKQLANQLRENQWSEGIQGIERFFSPDKVCKSYIIDKTYKDSPNQLLTSSLLDF